MKGAAGLEESAVVVLRRSFSDKGYGFAEIVDGTARGGEAICGLDLDGVPVKVGEPFACVLQRNAKGWRVVRRADRSAPALVAAEGVVTGRALSRVGRPYWRVALSGDASGEHVFVGQQQLLEKGLCEMAPGVRVVLDAQCKGFTYWATSLASPTAADAFGAEDRVERPAWVILDRLGPVGATLGAWDRATGIAVAADVLRSHLGAWGIRRVATAEDDRRAMADHELADLVAAHETRLRASGEKPEIDALHVALERQQLGGRVRWFAAVVLAPKACRTPGEREVVDWVSGVVEAAESGTGALARRPAGHVWFDDARVGTGRAPFFPNVVLGSAPLEDGAEVCVTLRAGKVGWTVHVFNVVASPAAIRA